MDGRNEHLEWRGRDYKRGIDGQKLAIVGFSHWGDAETPDFTRTVMEHVVVGDGHSFFTKIRSYFGFTDDEAFWNSVVFFNTLPTLVGEGDERYADGSKSQREAVPERVLRILDRCEPDKVVVFSRKGWNMWPKFSGSHIDEKTNYLPGAKRIEWGTYALRSGKEVFAFGLEHPQFAVGTEMGMAIRAILAFRPGSALPG